MIDKLRSLANIKYESAENKDEKTKYEIICKILKDNDCFKKMKTSTAYKILYDLELNENEVKKIYIDLVLN